MSEGQDTQAKASQNDGQVGWGQVAKGGRGGKKRSLWHEIDELKLKDSATQYKIRLIGDPYRFFKLYEPINVRLDPDYNHDLEVFQAGHRPSSRYAVWVFDRNDSNKIKLLKGGPMIFRQFGSYKAILNKDPGGDEGPEWSVSFSDPIGENGKPNPRLRQYRCMHLEPAPFTEEEKKQIAEHIAKYPYDKVIKGAEEELITKLWEEAKNAPEGALVPGSYLWYQAKKEQEDSDQDQADPDNLNLDPPKSQSDNTDNDGQSAESVDTSTEGDGFEETFNTGGSEEASENKGSTSLF